ncbi:MAG: glycoside hydrolase, partial [Acidobacteria bacterium]|nr:glycoside hydrolase [Acidobacteriota bacterium]
MPLRNVLLLFFVLALLGCGSPAERPATQTWTAMKVAPLEDPAGDGAAQPFLASGRNGSLLLSWIEPGEEEGSAAVRVARMGADGAWSQPSTVVSRNDLFVNWADFPSVVESVDGTLFVHWLQKSGEGPYAYHVMIARSGDDGRTWSEPARLHEDTSNTEHGFVSLEAHPSQPGIAAVWLDGREMSEGGDHDDGQGDMTMRFAMVGSDGAITGNAELDDRTCECCATGMAWSGNGPIVAYRDRSPDEVRDIAIVRQTAAGWSAPQTAHDDGWKIPGCPVNGPQIAARDGVVALAWFTMADGEPKVLATFSKDEGATFSPPVRLDSGAAAGRVDLVLLSDGTAVVSWLDGSGDDAAVVAREI